MTSEMNGADRVAALAQRVMRLEELSAFAERDGRHLSDEIAELNARLRDVTKRLARLESIVQAPADGSNESTIDE